MNGFVSIVNNQAISRRIAQNFPTVLSVGQEDMYQQDASPSNKQMDQYTKSTNFEKKERSRIGKTTEPNGRRPKIYHSSPIETTYVSTVHRTTKLVTVQ